MNDECLKIYKKNILNNAYKIGWDIYKKNDNIYFLIKEKKNNEKFNLEKDIILLHKEINDFGKYKKDN